MKKLFYILCVLVLILLSTQITYSQTTNSISMGTDYGAEFVGAEMVTVYDQSGRIVYQHSVSRSDWKADLKLRM